VVLIQILLPARGSDEAVADDVSLSRTRDELVREFGGLTAYLRSPASGVWTSPEAGVEEEAMVMVEILADAFDVGWWRSYAETLKRRFSQETMLIRASEVHVLDN